MGSDGEAKEGRQREIFDGCELSPISFPSSLFAAPLPDGGREEGDGAADEPLHAPGINLTPKNF